MEELNSTNDFVSNESIKDGESQRPIIKVVGVGGGGSNAITHMYLQGVPDITYALCNTDRQSLNASPVPVKLVLGPNVTFGLGAGNKPEVAKAAAEESIAEIQNLFNDGTRMVFITAGMGGGTGTGAAPVVAKIARDMDLLTVGIVTVPFLMEGEAKILKAMEGVDEMSKVVDALLVINNEILIEEFGQLDFISAFAKADDTLSNAAKSIAEIINAKGRINLDFNDVHTTLKNSGQAIISTGYGEGEKRVTMAVEDALNSPMLRKNDIASSKRVLFNLYFSPKADNPLKISEIGEFEEFTRKISGLDMIYGVAFDESLGNKVKVSILAAGLESKVLKDNEKDFENLKGKKVVRNDHFPQNEQKVSADSSKNRDKITELYGQKAYELQKHRDAQNFVLLTAEQMDNDKVLELLENTPAYDRKQSDAEAIRNGHPSTTDFDTHHMNDETSGMSEQQGGIISFF